MKSPITFACVVLLGTSAGAATYNAAVDFSLASSSTSPWTYGSSTTLGGAVTPFPSFRNNFDIGSGPNAVGLAIWYSGLPNQQPSIAYNPTGSPIVLATPFTNPTWAPGQLSMHPGVTGDYSVLRFTAQAYFEYDISMTVSGLDPRPTSTDVHLFKNNLNLNSTTINSFGVPFAFNTRVILNPGDRIELAVGWGSNQEYSFDSTAVELTIQSVPESRTLGFIIAGISSLAACGLLRRWRTKA